MEMKAGIWVLALGAAGAISLAATAAGPPTLWHVDNLTSIGGHGVTVLGSPKVAEDDSGRAVAFDGVSDGIFVDANPIEGLARFTVEVVFWPDADGPAEQRFLHFQEHGEGRRVLFETRMLPGGQWALDTFLRDGDNSLPLLDRALAHPAGQWHAAALTYDGETMTHYVNGKQELTGKVKFGPMTAGRVSIGVRQNKVHWFKGKIRAVRVTPRVLTPAEMLTATSH